MFLSEERDNWELADLCIWNKCGKQGRKLARDGKGMLSMSEALFSLPSAPLLLKTNTQPYPMPLGGFLALHV